MDPVGLKVLLGQTLTFGAVKHLPLGSNSQAYTPAHQNTRLHGLEVRIVCGTARRTPNIQMGLHNLRAREREEIKLER